MNIRIQSLIAAGATCTYFTFIARCDTSDTISESDYTSLFNERTPAFEDIQQANSEEAFSRLRRVWTTSRPLDPKIQNACMDLRKALALRAKYHEQFRDFQVNANSIEWKRAYAKFRDGICQVEYNGDALVPIPSAEEFMDDLQFLRKIYKTGFNRKYCWARLQMLEHTFNIYWLMNSAIEQEDVQEAKRDFYTVCKVDNHIHMAAAVTSHELLSFLKEKLDEDGNEVVLESDGKTYTLKELAQAQLVGKPDGVENLTVEKLQTKHGIHMFDDFDAFNASYNILKSADLRKVFLKADGRYFDELVKKLNSSLESDSMNIYKEPRLSVYGRKYDEWENLSKWIVEKDLVDLSNIKFMIQMPRVYTIWKMTGKVKNFGEMLQNFFEPMFEATLHPEKHPEMALFLENLVGIDSVDDESVPDNCTPPEDFPHPNDWNGHENPNYSYYCYYIWANLVNLNALRRAKGLNEITFRPHSGETGPSHHLASTFILAQSINHGIRLRENTVLQYLYYIAQVGISVSPLSNNVLFKKLAKSPFYDFHMRGLNVTLSTDDPLQFHNTNQPLLEEYTVMQQMFKIDSASMCEMARYSVSQSGLSDKLKKQELGEFYKLPGVLGSNESRTGVPNCRSAFRHEALLYEYQLLMRKSANMTVQPWCWTDLTYFPVNGELESYVDGTMKTEDYHLADGWVPPQYHSRQKSERLDR